MVSSARSLFTWGRRRFGEELAELESTEGGFEGKKHMFLLASGTEGWI
jgi:hypothetical protein